jgi:hypothetical protein
MQSLLAFLLLLVIVAAVLPLVRLRRAQRRQLAALALRCGWTYTPADPWDLPIEIEGLWLGAWGHDRRCRDVFSVPTQIGSLWLTEFSRQMGSGRHRRTERFAVAIARVHAVYGGIAILPAGTLFAPADPFARYRPVTSLGGIDLSGRQIWAERPAGEWSALVLLSGLMSQLPTGAGIEVRGPVAAIHWPLARRSGPQDFLDLQTAGRWLLDLLEPQAGPSAAMPKVSFRASRGTP